MIDIPTLETPRLRLRPFHPDDVEPYVAMMADPEVARHLGDGRPLGRFDAWRQLTMFIGHWTLRGFGVWAVEERATGAFIGRIGHFEPDGWPGFEVAYTLARHAWGRGYAREGAAAALAHAHAVLGRREVLSIIRPANVGSQGVARALGATPGATIDFFGAPAVLWHYPPPAAAPPASGRLDATRLDATRLDATRLDAVHPVLMARDVAASLAFYARLGFVPTFVDAPPAPRYAVVRRGGVELHLQWGDAGQWAHAGDRPAYRFRTPDVDALHAGWHAAGALDVVVEGWAGERSPWATPADTPWGTREFHVRDPGGNVLQFYTVRGGA